MACKVDGYLESLLASKVPRGQSFLGMQPQEMAAGLKGNRKTNLIDMLAFLFFEYHQPCYVREEIKKDEPRPYFMGYHMPAFYVEIYGSYCVFQCTE